MLRVAAGDQEALAALYDQYGQAVYALCLRIVHDQGTAQELTQETFVRVWRSAATYHAERGRLSTWLLRIAHNLALNEIRRRQSRPAITQDGGWEEEVAQLVDTSREGDPAQAATLREEADHVRTALAQLPEVQRKPIEMAFFGGLSQAEVAEELGDPLGTVKSRIRLGMQRLRELLIAAGEDGAG